MRPAKKTTEYLLYGETLQAPDELQWIIEEGFPFLPDNFSLRAPEIAVLLSNSIGLADLHRLKVEQRHPGVAAHLLTVFGTKVYLSGSFFIFIEYLSLIMDQALPEQFQQTTFWRSRATGWLLIVKACLGTSVQDSSGEHSPQLILLVDGWSFQ